MICEEAESWRASISTSTWIAWDTRRPRGSARPARIRAQAPLAPLAVAGAGAESFSIGAVVDGVVEVVDLAQGRGCCRVMIAGRWHRRGWDVVGVIGWFGRLLPESRLRASTDPLLGSS